MRYYWMSINNDIVNSVAFAPKGTHPSHYLIDEVKRKKSLPFSLELHRVGVSSELIVKDICDDFYDYQPNSLAWPIMSNKMKSVIEGHLTGKEYIEWKTVTIKGKDISREYFIPVFTKKLDTLLVEKTVIVKQSGIILKPCFDKNKIKGLSMFHGHNNFWSITTQIYVSDAVKRAIKASGIQEIMFSPVHIE